MKHERRAARYEIRKLLRTLRAAWAAFWLPTDDAWRDCGVRR